jgi:hypothetical protein
MLLLLVDWGLRLLPFQTMQRWAKPAGSAQVSPGDQAAARNAPACIARTINMVDRAIRWHLYPMTCLRRALVLQRLLARAGLETELKIGVRKVDGGLQAHAWIEYQGRPQGERDQHLSPYSTISSA